MKPADDRHLEQAEAHCQIHRQMMKRCRNWISVTMSTVFLAACGGPDLPPLAYTPPVAPTPEKALQGARNAANEERLTGFIEVSGIREGESLGPGEYMLCLRGAASSFQPRQTYAVFFNNDEYKGVRLSVILDECEKQTFSPLPPDVKSNDKSDPKAKKERISSISLR
jgi:hypothetical protein